MSKKPIVRIRNWAIYSGPPRILIGTVDYHPVLGKGPRNILTSNIIRVVPHPKRLTRVVTQYTIYELEGT
jgi:hypothetical protein